ncbi:MAG: hypothetical protein KatS3mg118_1043 [Paracoccaceae bacterium]|nr:MAG: hypothetical protein KatS3mg118_1043 [Paracoccaceae bacterium]
MSPEPSIDGKGTHGGYAARRCKPIALHMVAEIARDPETRGLPISGIGGITTWRDAAEFIALGAGTVQVCTAAMTYGFKVVQEMIAGLSTGSDEKGYARLSEIIGRAVPNVTDWQYLNLNYVTKARIDQDLLHQVRALLCGLRGHLATRRSCIEAGPDLRGDRRRMRRLQPVRQCLPGRWLHHHGAAARRRHRPAHRPDRVGPPRRLDHPPQQSPARRRRIAPAARPAAWGPRNRRGRAPAAGGRAGPRAAPRSGAPVSR